MQNNIKCSKYIYKTGSSLVELYAITKQNAKMVILAFWLASVYNCSDEEPVSKICFGLLMFK